MLIKAIMLSCLELTEVLDYQFIRMDNKLPTQCIRLSIIPLLKYITALVVLKFLVIAKA